MDVCTARKVKGGGMVQQGDNEGDKGGDGNLGVQLATKEEESYKGMFKNLSQVSHVLGVMCQKASLFDHLEHVDKLAFSGQLVHELSLRRVANQGVKYLEGLTYLIGCEVTQFTKKDFCLITRLRYEEPYYIDVEPSNIRICGYIFLTNLSLLERVARVGERRAKVKQISPTRK
ncbi:unnamed protein product [Malus baccata var. baccata]